MHYDSIIVGAGFAGMYMLHRLRKAGYSAIVLEAADGVGGTWYWNRYPGARCDVQSIDYSCSFDAELEQEWEWTEKYATQPEILRYANHIADRFDLRRDIRFETRVKAAHYHAAGHWMVETERGETLSAQFYVMATGCLSKPKELDIPGKETFAGTTYHTAYWPHSGVDFSGQRVAIIGTGSSALQTIPIVAEQARQLSVYQRTPAYSLPAGNRPLDRDTITALKARYPEHRALAQKSIFGVPDLPMDTATFDVSESERERVYEEAWASGTLNRMLLAFNDLLVNQAANDTAAEFVRNKIRGTVRDQSVAEALCPRDFPIGTKRPCLDTHYFETFNRDNVALIDLRRTPLIEITQKGIRTSAGEEAFDSIIFATGFDAMTGALVNVDIHGVEGRTLKDHWSNGPRTYLGLCIPGFPNFFTITGPGSPSVMSNMMVSIEQHVDWIAECMNYLRSHGYARIEATPAAEAAWVDHVNEVADATLFPQANSWYMGANVPGKPRVFLPYIGGCKIYREKCDEVAHESYRGFMLTAGSGALRSAG